MPRVRLLKPSFFTNDALGEIEPLGRLLFAGLWCIADREGRLPDRPRRIKAEILPYDEVDVSPLLDELAARSLIVRYEVDGRRFVQVTTFSKHQRPHAREVPSTIPGTAEARPGPCPGGDEGQPEPCPAGEEEQPGEGCDTASAQPGSGLAVAEDSSEPLPGGDDGDHSDSDGGSVARAQPGNVLGEARDASGTPLTFNQIQIQEPGPDPAAAAGAHTRAREQAAAPADGPLSELLRHWERTTGAAVTPAVSQWLAAELATGLPVDLLHDAISETAANGSKAWKYTKAIVERWRSQGRTPRGGSDGRGRYRNDAERRLYGPCRATGRPHAWTELDGWCPQCQEQEPITEDMLRRRGLLVE